MKKKNIKAADISGRKKVLMLAEKNNWFQRCEKEGIRRRFKPGIVSYPNYLKNAPSMSQLIHNCRKNHAILRDISCGTTCKKLHFTYLFFYQTTPIFAVVTTSWNFFSILNEQASKTLTSFVTANSATTYLSWALWNAARCATIHPLVGTHDCLVI